MTHLRTSAGSRRLLLPGRQTSAARGEESIATQVQGWATSTSSYNIDPATDSLKLLTKQNAKLAEENRTLRFYKQRHDVIDKQMSEARIKIGSLAQMLKQNEKEGQRMRDGLERERMEYGQRVTALEKENHAAQRDLEMANNKHTAEVTRLKEEHRHGIIRLKQEKDSIAAKAQNDLDMANKKHAAEVFLLNGEHRRETDAITSKLQEMSIKTQKMQATIDEKRRTIAAQDIRMASYNKQIHGVISDSELEQKFKGLFLMFDSLFEAVPRPQTYVVDTAFDPNDFLGRNSSRGSRVWHKFLRKVCWDVLMRGFFQRQPGFGSFGCQGEGYLTLLHLYGLFAKSNGQDPSGPRVNFPNDKITNGWRASLFEAILRKVTSTVKDRTVTGFSAFFRENVKIVMDDLEETLQKVCQGALDSRVSEIILRLCNEAGILSLQMGAQQRVIVLETCYHQDWVQSGAVFQDDNRYNEDELQVDIMVQPSLKRIGDGRQDLATEKVLVIGHIVSLKAQGGV
ncbi:hypothetical protein F4824DRAFT_455508 [Ustulina deusta]|nr:hypothetical protein F4824DRAFT_455508 [Ustulina deusta]